MDPIQLQESLGTKAEEQSDCWGLGCSLFLVFLSQGLTVAQASPKLKAILLSQSSRCWNYRHEPALCQDLIAFENESDGLGSWLSGKVLASKAGGYELASPAPTEKN